MPKTTSSKAKCLEFGIKNANLATLAATWLLLNV